MNPFKCSVCTDPETSENQIVSCENCDVKVHMFCYGIESFAPVWKCSPCETGSLDPRCTLCLGKGGALKKTTCGKWSHVICALFTAGVDFEDKDSMEPINVSNLTNARRNKTCIFCQKSYGFCGLCATQKCKNRLHITCAQKSNCLKEVTNKKNGSIKFRAFCPDHKPNDSSRRISSQFVPEVLAEKNKKKQMQQIEKEQVDLSAKINAEWLVLNPFAKHLAKQQTKTPEILVEKRVASLNYSPIENKATPNIMNVVCQSESYSTKTKVDSKKVSSKSDKEKYKGTLIGSTSSNISNSNDVPLENNLVEKRQLESDFIEIAVDNHSKRHKSSKTVKENTMDTLFGNLSTKSLLWDSMDLHLGSNKENFINFDHACLKDEKISKVSIKVHIVFCFHSQRIKSLLLILVGSIYVLNKFSA